MYYIITIPTVLVLWYVCVVTSLEAKNEGNRVCVVGAGVAGLSSARHLLAAGQQVTVLEATAHVGGTWRYDPRVGLDEYGRPVHTSMYKNLRANVPYQLMELPGYPLSVPAGTSSFVNATTYYQYLRDYANYFQLHKYIQFLREVVWIYRQGAAWRVIHRDVATGQQSEDEFDFVLVCVGHYSKPRMPNIPGENIFKGKILHSHDYRFPEPFDNRRVLIVGAGPSALDLVTTLTNHSSRVLHSHHSRSIRTPFPENYVAKPDVVQYTERGVLFRDGSYEDVDDVIYGTGYGLNFPFLHQSCGLNPQPSSLTPLYRSLVNIPQPTMLVLGLTVHACAVITIATQARYAAAVVAGRAKLPSQQFMYQEWRRQFDDLVSQGKKMSEIHAVNVGVENVQYYNNLTSEANIPPVPPVLPAMCATDQDAKLENFYTFRQYEYTVLDEEHFIRRLPDAEREDGHEKSDCWTEALPPRSHPIVVLD